MSASRTSVIVSIISSIMLTTLLASCAASNGTATEPKKPPYRHEVQILVDMLNRQMLQEEVMARLEEIGGDDSADVFYRILIDERNDQNFRTDALCALGRIGTDAALERIQAWRAHIRQRNGEFQLEPHVRQDRFCAYEEIKNVVIGKSPDGKSWAMFEWDKYGTDDPYTWITSSTDGKSWKNPVALKRALWEMSENDFLRAVKEGHTAQFETTDDADKDGISDEEESSSGFPVSISPFALICCRTSTLITPTPTATASSTAKTPALLRPRTRRITTLLQFAKLHLKHILQQVLSDTSYSC